MAGAVISFVVVAFEDFRENGRIKRELRRQEARLEADDERQSVAAAQAWFREVDFRLFEVSSFEMQAVRSIVLRRARASASVLPQVNEADH